jgi:hypothetical protein
MEMMKINPRSPTAFFLALNLVTPVIANAADTPRQATTISSGATQLGGALPGGAVISARSALLTPASGGLTTAVPIAADGGFRASGLAAGSYSLKLSSVTVAKQTQGTSFGEKVNAGLHAAGGALAQGGVARASINDSMPNRISMNVTVARRVIPLVVDGDGTDVTVGTDGLLEGSAKGP